ncbi:MAG: DUF222 domain-containing protein [Acidimicrobiia bacterium]
MRAGELSPAQADVIARAAAEDPDAETDLLAHAGHAGFRGLKIECDRVRAAARRDDVERGEKNHRERSLVHRRRENGTGRIEIHGPLDRTAQIMAAIEPFERELFVDNRRAGRRDHPDAVAFDALLRLCTGVTSRSESGRSGRRPLATVVVHVSDRALGRGSTERGEICEVEGFGPISVGTARRIASDSFLEIVLREGENVTRVARRGRTIVASLRTAVEVRDPRCVIAGCEVDRHLEIDHNIPVAAGGLTALGNIARVCAHHHDEKTRRDLRRIGPLGRQRLVTRTEFQQLARDAGPAPPER